jgi:hypothetical protein
MNSYKLIFSICVSFTLASTIFTGVAHTEADPFETDLIAAQHYDAGEVLVWNNGDNLFVKYIADEDWQITETHLHVAESMEDIPQKNGNPIPGQFDYKEEHDPAVTEFTYEIDNTWDEDDELFIAAHAVVCEETTVGGLEETEAMLPDIVTASAVHAITIGHLESYFVVTISGGTYLDGTHNGWCVDLDALMHDYLSFTAKVYSSYEMIPIGLINHPENLDLVNWILNQDYVGTSSPGGYGIYTYGDVQRAIWELIEDKQSTIYLGPWNINRANEIIADAEDPAVEGFEPGCDEVFGVLLVPVDEYGRRDLSQGQICIIPVPIECETEWNCETAWGDGLDFPGRNWAMYFTYTIQ